MSSVNPINPENNPFRRQLIDQRMRNEQLATIFDPVFDPEQNITYEDIELVYAHSRYGQYHATQQLRWKPFDYDREQKLRDFGADAHPVEHMRYTHDAIVTPMLFRQIESKNSDQLTTADIRALRFAALTHDIGECEYPALADKIRIVGDVPLPDKTKNDELDEQIVRTTLYGELYGYLDTELIERAESIVIRKELGDYAADFFQVAERVGYLMTGCVVATVVIGNTNFEGKRQDDPRVTALREFMTERFIPWTNEFESERQEYPFVDEVVTIAEGLQEQLSSISSMYITTHLSLRDTESP